MLFGGSTRDLEHWLGWVGYQFFHYPGAPRYNRDLLLWGLWGDWVADHFVYLSDFLVLAMYLRSLALHFIG